MDTKKKMYKHVDMDERFINLTPHDLVFLMPVDPDSLKKEGVLEKADYVQIAKIRPQGTYVRLIPEKAVPVETLENGIDILPPPCFKDHSPKPRDFLSDESKGLIVSSLMAEYWASSGFEWEGGYYSPDAGPTSSIRYPRGHAREGEIIGIQRLICWKPPCA